MKRKQPCPYSATKLWKTTFGNFRLQLEIMPKVDEKKTTFHREILLH